MEEERDGAVLDEVKGLDRADGRIDAASPPHICRSDGHCDAERADSREPTRTHAPERSGHGTEHRGAHDRVHDEREVRGERGAQLAADLAKERCGEHEDTCGPNGYRHAAPNGGWQLRRHVRT